MDDQQAIEMVMTEYMEIVPQSMAIAMVALGNAMSHGDPAGVMACLDHIESELDAVVSIAAKVTAAAVRVQDTEVSDFQVPDDLSGLEDL